MLAPAVAQGVLGLAIHPAMTFTGTSLDVARLAGCPFAITAPAALQPIGHALVAEMGGESVVIAGTDRGAYHAALAHGANHAVTLVTQAMRMLAEIGIEDPGAFIRPLVTAAVEGAFESGEARLTGPIQRGDVGTVVEHLETVDTLAADVPALADIPPTYRALARATTDRAEARNVIDRSVAYTLRTEIEDSAN